MKEEKYHIALIDDDYSEKNNSDSRLSNFVSKAKKRNIIFKYGEIDIKGCDLVICDIEIWDKPIGDNNRQLVKLGFDYIDESVTNHLGEKPYLILTNCTGTLHMKIKDIIESKHPNLNIQIKSKRDFLNETNLNDSINEIINMIEKSKGTKGTKGTTRESFDIYKDYLTDLKNYPIKCFAEYINTPEELEIFIERKATILIDDYEKLKVTSENFKKLEKTEEKSEEENKEKFDFFQNFRETKLKDYKGGEIVGKIKEDDVIKNLPNFVKKLIFRRMVIYIHYHTQTEIETICPLLYKGWNVKNYQHLYSAILMFSDSLDFHKLDGKSAVTEDERKFWERLSKSDENF